MFAAGWSLTWVWMRGAVERSLQAERASLARSGFAVGWSEADVSGYPFRLDLHLAGLSLREPSGRRYAVPLIKAEALMLTPGHWVIEVASDIAVTQPDGAAATIRSDVLRASLSDADAQPPRVSVEGIGLRITGAASANPFFFTEARELHIHTRAGPANQGAAYIEVDAATPKAGEPAAALADGRPTSVTLDAIYSHAGQLRGATWPAMVEAWRTAGGSLSLRALTASAGDVTLETRPGPLSVDRDGRLAGSLRAALRGGPQALAALTKTGIISPTAAGAASAVIGAAGRGAPVEVTFDFQAGRTTLGPVAIGPAPKVY